MRSIRKFAYAAFLMLGVFSILPSPAAGQNASGHFTLAHEVHLRDQVLTAGRYAFTLKSVGPSEMMVLRNLTRDPRGAGIMLLVSDVETPKEYDVNRLTLVSRNGQSFVSALELPEFDIVLRFAVPDAADERGINSSSGQ